MKTNEDCHTNSKQPQPEGHANPAPQEAGGNSTAPDALKQSTSDRHAPLDANPNRSDQGPTSPADPAACGSSGAGAPAADPTTVLSWSQTWNRCTNPDSLLDQLLERVPVQTEDEHRRYIEFACRCAEQVLQFFESMHPRDRRPRQALAAARSGNLSAAQAARWESKHSRTEDVAVYAEVAARSALLVALAEQRTDWSNHARSARCAVQSSIIEASNIAHRHKPALERCVLRDFVGWDMQQRQARFIKEIWGNPFVQGQPHSPPTGTPI